LIQDEGALLPDGGSLVKESLRDKGLNMEMQMTWNSLDNLERGKQHKMRTYHQAAVFQRG
jgi:hypothetical protein